MDTNDLFEQIVKANPDAFEVENDDCPMGDDCSIHFRLQERYEDSELETGRYIDYVGDYVVVTEAAPLSPLEALMSLMDAMEGTFDGFTSEDFHTTVIKVGEGTLSDTNNLSDEEYNQLVVHDQSFNRWEDFAQHHNDTVKMVQGWN